MSEERGALSLQNEDPTPQDGWEQPPPTEESTGTTAAPAHAADGTETAPSATPPVYGPANDPPKGLGKGKDDPSRLSPY